MLLRTIAVYGSVFILRTTLFFGISIVAFLLLYTRQDYLANTLHDTNAYERFLPALIETNGDQPLFVGSDITLSSPEIVEIATTAFPPNFFRLTAENTIDDVYSWLDGKQTTLEYQIDVTEQNTALINGLANFAVSRVTSLPECTQSQLAMVDLFSTKCRHPSFDVEHERTQLINELSDSSPLFRETIFPLQNLLSDTPDINSYPRYYRYLGISWLPIVLVIAASCVLLLYASTTRKKGWRKISKAVLTTSFSLIIFTFLFSFIIPTFSGGLPLLSSADDSLGVLLSDISITLGRDFATMTLYICLPLIVVSGIGLLSTRPSKPDKYAGVARKSGLQSSNSPQKRRMNRTTIKKAPIQSSETSSTKPARSKKQKKYRTIPKKEV